MESLAKTFEAISQTTKKKEKQQILTQYLSTLNDQDLIVVSKILLDEYVTNVGPQSLKGVMTTQQSLFDTSKTSIQSIWDALQQLTFSKSGNQDIIRKLFVNMSPIEQKYIAMILLNNINIGVSDAIMLDSLANARNIDGIRMKYFTCNTIEKIITGDYRGVEPLQPVRAMLAGPRKGALPGRFIAQTKLDGFRFSFHKMGDNWKIFSRRCEDISNDYLGVGASLHELLSDYDSIIIDGELIAESMNYQESRRKDTPVNPVVFDILYLNGQSLIMKTMEERHEILQSIPVVIPDGIFHMDDLEQFYLDSLNKGYEGVVIKDLSQTYLPHERGWIKVKKGVDTMDLVIMGAEPGEGKRSEVFGSFILGCMYEGEFSPLCKVGTGFSDLQLQHLHELLTPDIISQNDREIWFTPKYVVEIDYFEITDSPKYKSGKSLRFPVFKMMRADKRPTDIHHF